MKLVKTLLTAAALLLLLVPAAGAGEASSDAATPLQTPAVPADGLAEDLFGADADCQPGSEVASAAEEQDPVSRLAFQSCGSCSSSNCNGAIRGQSCSLPFGGWGNCNIYSGGYRCSTGGWECSCGSGPLP